MIEKEVNPHFEDFLFNWNQKFQFLVGGYGSSKSYHVATKIILKLLEEKRTCLVVREVFETHRESTFSLFEEIIESLGLGDYIFCGTAPMIVKFPNGSRIIFKGMDNPRKLKSINNISLIWLEECSEIKYAGFKELLGRLRHPSLKLHMILSTNPVGEDNWTYKHFFKDKQNKRLILDDQELYEKRTAVKGNTFYHHSNAEDNLFLPLDYIAQLDELAEYDPDLHRIARLGQFGINGERVFPQFEEWQHKDVMRAIAKVHSPIMKVGMDFGFTTSYNALLRLAIDPHQKILYIYWEYYTKGKLDHEIEEDIKEFKESRELIVGDNADVKSIAYFNKQGFNFRPSYKFQGSRVQYTKKVKRFRKIICSHRCENTIYELQDLTYAVDKQGAIIEDEFKIDPHTLSAIWYAIDDYDVTDLKEEAKGRPSNNRTGRRRQRG